MIRDFLTYDEMLGPTMTIVCEIFTPSCDVWVSYQAISASNDIETIRKWTKERTQLQKNKRHWDAHLIKVVGSIHWDPETLAILRL